MPQYIALTSPYATPTCYRPIKLSNHKELTHFLLKHDLPYRQSAELKGIDLQPQRGETIQWSYETKSNNSNSLPKNNIKDDLLFNIFEDQIGCQ